MSATTGSYQERQRVLARGQVQAAAQAVAVKEKELQVARDALDDAIARACNEASIAVSEVAQAADVSRQTAYTAARRAHERRHPQRPFE